MLRISLAFLLLLASQLLLAAPQMHALPVLPDDAHGAIYAHGPGLISGNILPQPLGDTTLTNWGDFNLGEAASVTLNSNPSASLTLNRIENSGTSTIHGNLNANAGLGISEVRIHSDMLLNNDINLSVTDGGIVMESGVFSGASITISAGANLVLYDSSNDVTLIADVVTWLNGNPSNTKFTIVQTVVPLPAAFYLFLTAFAYLIRFSSKNNYSGN